MEKTMQQEIVSNFFSTLLKKKIPVRDGAHYLKISHSYLVQIGKRQRNPSAEILGRMVKYLDGGN